MADYPILFRLRHVVRGENFEAIVSASGRTVIGQEDDEWWCHGVEPGGLSEGGEGPTVAFERFSAAFRRALDDIAEDADGIQAFRSEALMLFVTDDHDASRWENALRRIQENPELDEAFKTLPRQTWTGSVLLIEPLASLAAASLSNAEPERALPRAA